MEQGGFWAPVRIRIEMSLVYSFWGVHGSMELGHVALTQVIDFSNI